MDAKLIGSCQGKEMRYAKNSADTWPGYHESFPLGKAGYWIGDHRSHKYVGRKKDTAENAFNQVIDAYNSDDPFYIGR